MSRLVLFLTSLAPHAEVGGRLRRHPFKRPDDRTDQLGHRIGAVAADVADMKPRLRNVEIELRVLRWMVGTSIAGILGIFGLLLCLTVNVLPSLNTT
jgi:hypothetical protein